MSESTLCLHYEVSTRTPYGLDLARICSSVHVMGHIWLIGIAPLRGAQQHA
jgi:hypothetical protein